LSGFAGAAGPVQEQSRNQVGVVGHVISPIAETGPTPGIECISETATRSRGFSAKRKCEHVLDVSGIEERGAELHERDVGG
jgi:hypothetical protein